MKKSPTSVRSLFSNRFADAFAKTIVVFGCLHILILTLAAVRGEVEALNAFRIVSLDILIPVLGHGLVNFVISYAVVLIVYGLIYRFLTNRVKDRDEPASR